MPKVIGPVPWILFHSWGWASICHPYLCICLFPLSICVPYLSLSASFPYLSLTFSIIYRCLSVSHPISISVCLFYLSLSVSHIYLCLSPVSISVCLPYLSLSVSRINLCLSVSHIYSGLSVSISISVCLPSGCLPYLSVCVRLPYLSLSICLPYLYLSVCLPSQFLSVSYIYLCLSPVSISVCLSPVFISVFSLLPEWNVEPEGRFQSRDMISNYRREGVGEGEGGGQILHQAFPTFLRPRLIYFVLLVNRAQRSLSSSEKSKNI